MEFYANVYFKNTWQVHGVHELQRQLQQLEQQLGDQNKDDDEESSGRNAQQIEGGASVW